MSKTPLTDHYTKRLRNFCGDEFVPIEFARKLERELTETRKLYDVACETAAKMHAAAVGEIKGPHIDPVQDVVNVRRERDTAQKALFNAVEDYEKAIEQRDRLAEALRVVMADYRLDGRVSAEADMLASEALAAVKGGSDE